jgi:hypothetical protein
MAPTPTRCTRHLRDQGLGSVVLRLLVDRRDELGRARTETVSRIHHLLVELILGGASKFLTRGQPSYLLRTVAIYDFD